MLSAKKYLTVLLIIVSSCAKEIYTDKDATNAKREAQKTGLTVMIRDIGSQIEDLSGFKISTTQCGEIIEGFTQYDGVANMMVVKGDVLLDVRKEGYVPVTAIVTTNTDEKERSNTVVIIPVFQQSGSINGKVLIKTPTSAEEPLADVFVGIDLNMSDMIYLALPGFLNNMEKYSPASLTYLSANIMQPVRTNASGEFQLKIPATVANIAYIVNVHETELTYPATQTVVTNGKQTKVVNIEINEK